MAENHLNRYSECNTNKDRVLILWTSRFGILQLLVSGHLPSSMNRWLLLKRAFQFVGFLLDFAIFATGCKISKC
jgi:hypothetical protein